MIYFQCFTSSTRPPHDRPKHSPIVFAVFLAWDILKIEPTHTLSLTHARTHTLWQARPLQESLAIGLGNIGAGLTRGFPISGSFSRSSENAFMDSQSSLPNLFTGLLIMFTLLFLTPLFYYLPQCALSANIIVAVLAMVDFPEAFYLWRTSKKEFGLWLLIFLVTLFESPETAIYVGLALCGAFVLFNATRAKVVFTSEGLVVVQLPGAEALSTYSNASTTEVTKTMPNSLGRHGTFMLRIEGTLSYACSFSFQVDIVLSRSQAYIQHTTTV